MFYLIETALSEGGCKAKMMIMWRPYRTVVLSSMCGHLFGRIRVFQRRIKLSYLYYIKMVSFTYRVEDASTIII